MLTDIKHRQNKLCFFTEKEAETDAHRQEGQGKLYAAFNRKKRLKRMLTDRKDRDYYDGF